MALEIRQPLTSFDFRERLDEALAIEDISDLLNMIGLTESADRLRVLKSYDGELDKGDKPLSLNSARSYAAFIHSFCSAKEPLLGVSPDGNLGADWKFDDGRYLGLSFEPGGRVVYAAILPGADPENPEQMYGQGCWPDIIHTLRNRGLDR